VSTSADQSQLSSSQFLQLLVAQLRYQDPSHPVDNATLMQETATLNQIQTMQQLAQASTDQMQAQQQQTAAGMVGRTVSYLDASGNTQSGYVSAATISGSSPSLVVGGQNVALSQVQQVIAPTS
jgi:flagellar basal-body rod modification protein FlgD